MSDSTLKITEIFHSLQGEARSIGLPTVFVRLTGCPLRCHNCDSAYAFHGGERREITDILAEVAGYKSTHVCVTGGEPLAQANSLMLMSALCDAGYQVSLETSGALDVSQVDARVSRVVDLKTPASGENHRNLWDNIAHLTQHDQIKFVICGKADFEWAAFKVSELDLCDKVGDVLFSPSFGQVNPAELAGWVIESGLPIRFQLQLHKILWGDEPGR
ncbi:7-carboxy-7-deazaguanine synthase QueE [Simiduia curdlanivorans]|uniref:7-carboxy-7-deazaguanine synthase n=1 Tax=Simiduia curdlanivorans TaxID=1492769 RepID=A0ABV8UYF8_9GAMM|nr:7-carboxy-7-deazaguanine synthase QueE [Simiduia curdlanivorans]MDN3640322.1 7-carboxy-7-deazaguanine synthase QueE [Simiduia curdlanivorans]